MKRLVVLAVLSCSAPRLPPPPVPKVAPAQPVEKPLVVAALPNPPEGRLPRTFTPTRYALRLHVDPAVVTFSGTVEIAGELAEPTALIWLHAEDLTMHDVSATQAGKQVRLVATMPVVGLLALQSVEPLAAGAVTVSIAYSGKWRGDEAAGGFRQTVNGAHYVLTQFEPDYARRAFPCIDEPDRKVPWRVTLDVPDGVVAASNAPIESEQSSGPFTTRTVRFKPTQPLPSYLVAFAVGPFDVVEATPSKSGIPIRILTLRGDSTYADQAKASAAQLLDRLEGWLGVPFGYPKVDFVAVPRTPGWWAAMENAGLVTFAADMLRKPKYWDDVMRHELAHHWFGNLVTQAWWDDIWLSESFAYWIGNDGSSTVRDYVEGFRTQWNTGARLSRVERPRHFLGGGMNAFGAINKGTRLLEQLEILMGRDKLTSALRGYLTKHAHSNATSDDLLRAFREVDPTIIDALTHYVTKVDVDKHGIRLACDKQARRIELTGVTHPAFACYAYDHDGKRQKRCGTFAAAKTSLAVDSKQCPKWVLPDSLHQVDLQDAELVALRDHAWPQLTPGEQRMVASYAFLGDSKRGPLRWSFIDKLARSKDDGTLALLTQYLGHFDHVVPPALRAKYDAWLVKTLGPRARQVGLVPRKDESNEALSLRAVGLVSIVARGDKQLQSEALGLWPKLEDLEASIRFTVLPIAVQAEPKLVDELMREYPTASHDRKQEIDHALMAVSDPLPLFAKYPEAIAAMRSYTKSRLLGRVCDETKRAEVEALSKEHLKGMKIRDFDWCIKERQLLEPELRAFLK